MLSLGASFSMGLVLPGRSPNPTQPQLPQDFQRALATAASRPSSQIVPEYFTHRLLPNTFTGPA